MFLPILSHQLPLPPFFLQVVGLPWISGLSVEILKSPRALAESAAPLRFSGLAGPIPLGFQNSASLPARFCLGGREIPAPWKSSWLEEPRAPALGAFASQTLASVGAVGEHAQRSLEKELRQVLAFSTLKFWIAKVQENRRRLFLRAELEQLNWHLE